MHWGHTWANGHQCDSGSRSSGGQTWVGQDPAVIRTTRPWGIGLTCCFVLFGGGIRGPVRPQRQNLILHYGTHPPLLWLFIMVNNKMCP